MFGERICYSSQDTYISYVYVECWNNTVYLLSFSILEKHNFLSFDNFKSFKSMCFFYKCLHGLAPPSLGELIHKKNTGRSTRSETRGDCEVHRRRTTFCQNVLSIKGSSLWNSLLSYGIVPL